MARFQDISLAFDDIIETPLSRRRKVEEASQVAQQRMAQAGGPFAALASGIAGSLPGITENVRTTARDAGLSAFQLPGEKLADQLKNINTNTEAGQRQAVALIQQIDPGRAEMLSEHYREKNAAKAEARLQAETLKYRQDQLKETIRSNKASEAQEADEAEFSRDQLDQRIAEWNAEQTETENLPDFYTNIAQNFPENSPVRQVYETAALTRTPHAAVQQALNAMSTNRSEEDKNRQITAMSASTGLSEAEATNLMFMMDNGLIDYTIQPDNTVIVGNIPAVIAQSMGMELPDGTESTIRLAPGSYQEPDYNIGEGLYDLAGYVPGVANQLRQLWNETGAQFEFLEGTFNERQAKAQSVTQDLMLDLRASTREELGSGRLSNFLVELIDEAIGLKGKYFDSKLNYRQKVRTASNRLSRLKIQLENDIEQGVYAANPSARSNATQQLSAVNKAIQYMSVPRVMVPAEMTVETVETATPASLSESILQMGETAYENLPQDVLDAIQRNLTNSKAQGN